MEARAAGEISILCLSVGRAMPPKQFLVKCYLPFDARPLIFFLNDEQAEDPQCFPPQGEGGQIDSVQRLMNFLKMGVKPPPTLMGWGAKTDTRWAVGVLGSLLRCWMESY